MKILQLTAIDLTVYRFLVSLMKAMRDEGWEVHFACADGEKARLVEGMGFPFHPIRTTRRLNPFEIARQFWDVYRLVKGLRPDIVHLHTPIMAFVGRLASKAARARFIIYTAHGFYHHEGMNPIRKWFFAELERFAGKVATDLMFILAQEDFAWARKAKLLPQKRLIKLMGIGCDLSFFSPTAVNHDKLRALRDEIGSGRLILTCGRVVREKGFFELVKASKDVLEGFPEAVFVLAGQGPEIDGLKRAARSNGVHENWRFLGWREEMRELLALSEFFVLPSWREGLPRSIIEAMAMAKPVVATDIRGCREEVVDGETGFLVPPKDPAALASAIKRLLSDEELALRMGRAGRKRAEELFDEKKIIQKQIEVIKSLADGTL